MMKIAILHSANQGFFPRFYQDLKSSIERHGDECILLSPKSGINMRNKLPNQILWGTRFNWFIHHLLYKITGLQDIFSFIDSLFLLKALKKEAPDLIHLNIINDQNINIPMLVKYTNRNDIPVVWTMHDCRAFTGRCAYFDEINCNKWQNGCGNCPQKELYMPTWIDSSHKEWEIRKKWHTAFKNLTIVTPSIWLSQFVHQSFFKRKITKVIYNGINLDKFSTKANINVRKLYDIKDGIHLILGVSANWEFRKGIKYFIELSRIITPKYKIVLIGNMPSIIKEKLPSNILHIEQTTNVQELAAWYQIASVFINPTLADNFPTTNIEALASGTPVITFKTGGSIEAIDEHTGIVVETGDTNKLFDAIKRICNSPNEFSEENCKKRSRLFSNTQYDLYVNLYHSIINMR